MTGRSFEDAQRQFQSSLGKVKEMTKEQLQAAGFAPQPTTDPNAGLPRYEDLVGQQAQPEPTAPAMLEAHDHPIAEHVRNPYAQPAEPANDAASLVPMLIQQVQLLMQENAKLREQLMQMMQGGQMMAPQQQQRQIPRASQMSEEQRWNAMTGGDGLLG